jgi:hypothetical protein
MLKEQIEDLTFDHQAYWKNLWASLVFTCEPNAAQLGKNGIKEGLKICYFCVDFKEGVKISLKCRICNKKSQNFIIWFEK